MAIKDFFHPIFRKALEADDDMHGLHDTIVDTLQAPLDQAKKDEINAKIDMYLDTSRGEYLDRFGSWFGLSRKKDWSDDYYRDRMKKHVLHERNTINGIRMALANFLETEIKNIYIYEPYRDMFIWNKSFWNTRAFYTSPYYRYAVIDINIDAPIKPRIVDIINLFRPAGVIWVLTNNINGISLDAPIIDLVSPKKVYLLEEDINYVGFGSRKALEINPGLDSANAPITNPFIYNDSDSLWNGGKVYYDIVHQNQNFTYLGQMYTDYVPGDTDTFADARAYSEQYVTNQYASNIKGEGQTFSLSPEQNNLLGEITGRNLLLDSATQSSSAWAVKNDNNSGEKYLDSLSYKATFAWNAPKYSYSNLLNRGVIDYDKDYTFSVMLKASNDLQSQGNLYFYLGASNKNDSQMIHVNDIPNHWIQVSVTFRLDKNSEKENDAISAVMTTNCDSGYVLIAGYKLEKCNKATDWTPAPEDNLGIFLRKVRDIVPGNYQVGIRAYANTSKTETINLTFNATDGKNVTQTISSSVGTERHYFTRQINIPEDFKSDGTVTFNVGNTTLDFVSIKKATNAPMYYSLSKDDTRKVTGLASAIDVQRFLMAYDNNDLTSDFSKLDSTFDYFAINTSLYSNVNNEVTLWAFNFQLGLWINYGTENIKRGWNYLTTSLGAISPFMNNEGIVFYKLTFKKQNTVRVNYFGLDFGYVSEELPSAVAESGVGVVVHSEGYRPRVDPTADGAHLYLDYLTQNIEE